MRRVVLGLMLVAGGTSCRQVFGIHDPSTGDGGAVDAASELDAMTCSEASVTCAGPSTLRTCTGPGVQPIQAHCGWGCVEGDASTLSHCGVLQPQGGAVTAADLGDMSALADVSLSTATINATTGQILVGAMTFRAPGLGVISGIDFEVRGKVAVFRVRSAVLGDVAITGAYAVAIVANGDLTVTGTVDAQGACTDRTGGPGGSNGGASRNDGVGTGGGAGAPQGTDGGGGAGYGSTGGTGGASAIIGGANGGAAYGDPTIMTLVGGSGGGAGGDGTTALSAHGGGGGGGLQLVSNASVIVTGTINAGGCGGDSGASGAGGGGGGGAGGTVLVEAPGITIVGAVAANGGGGGGGGAGSQPGGNATADAVAASGGASNHGGGGAGGNAAHPPGNPGENNTYGGGGGGAVGRLRFESLSGSVNGFGATSPMPSIAAATVQ